MAEWLIGIEGVVLVALFACSAFFSASETALFSLNSLQVHRIRTRLPLAGARLQAVLDKPTRVLSTLLIGNTLVNMTASAIGFRIAEHYAPGHGEAIAIPTMTLLLLLVGEVTPKRYAMQHGERIAPHCASLLIVLNTVMTPLRAGLEAVSRGFSKHLRAGSKTLTADEFKTVVEVGQEEGVLDEEERSMVDGIMRLEETKASDVMTPRVDLIGIDLDDPLERQLQLARGTHFHYLPVYRGSLDNVEGLLDVARFLLADELSLAGAITEPFFVPESAALDSLLATFQKENRRVAFVVDEYGGTAGLLSRGDILEAIVATVRNEYQDEQAEIQPVGQNRWLLEGSTSLQDINYELTLQLEAEGADRIAGWVAAHSGRIPKPGDVVTAQSCRVTVQRVRRRRITQVLLEKLVPDETKREEIP